MKKLTLLSTIIILSYSICYAEENSIFYFDANENLFTAYAFMNAAGYNHDWSEMHQIRVEIRDYLDRNLSSEFKTKMNNFYEQHGGGDFSSYGIYALLLSAPPEFITKNATLEQKDLLKEYDGLDDLYREFYEEAKVKELWKKYKPILQGINDEYKPFAEIALNDIIKYCKLEKDYFSKRASKIYFSICPLMSHFTAYTAEVDGNLYIIHGPSKSEPSTDAFYHEALHHVVNPLTKKHIDLVNQYKELLDVSSDKRNVGYDVWESNVDDSFCRTTSMVISGIHSGSSHEDVQGWVKNEYKLGFILCMHLFEKLSDYENSKQTFDEYYPMFFNTINIEKEKKRWEDFWKNSESNIK